MIFFKRRNDNKKENSSISQFPEEAFQKIKKPKGDILFNKNADHLLIPDAGSGWLVAYDRSSNTFCQSERILIKGTQIQNSDLIRMMQSIEPLSDTSRVRICLYIPGKKNVFYIKGTLDENQQYANAFLLDPRMIVHAASHRYVYTSDGGLLSVGLAGKLFIPKSVYYFTPSEIKQPDQLLIRRSDFQKNDILYYGIYNRNEKEMFPFLMTEDTIRLSEIIEKCDFLKSEIPDNIFLCLISVGEEVSCSYMSVGTIPADPDAEAYDAISLDNKYNALITEPALIPNNGYIALARTATGRIIIQPIEQEHLDKYHNTLISEDLPDVPESELFVPFDAEEMEFDSSYFFRFIDVSARALTLPGITKAQNYQLQKRIIFNLSEMLAKASDIKSKYEKTEISYDNEWPHLYQLMQMIDDDIIMQSLAARYLKLFMLNSKYNRPCDQEEHISNIMLKYDDTPIFSIGSMFLRIDIVEIRNQVLTIEGYLRTPEKSIIDDSMELITYVNSVAYPNTIVPRYSDRYIYNRTLSKDLGFMLSVPLTQDRYSIAFGIKTNGFVSMCTSIEYTDFSPISNKLRNAYYECDNYVITSSRNRLYCQKYYDEEALLEYEERLHSEIMRNCGDHADEIISLRQYYMDYMKQEHPDKKWIMIDRADRADDNAEVLFRHVVARKYPNVEPIFILSQEAPQYEELTQIGTVYDFHSEDHLKAFLTCSYVFSSQMAPSTTNPFNEDYDYFRDIIRKKHFVFLQHGVTHNDNGNAFSRYSRNFYGIVVNAAKEYDYMLTPEFNNSPESIWLTGMPRYDLLHNDDKRMITIMPTWRKNLTNRIFDEEKGTKVWDVADNFTTSEYFTFYNNLINDDRLIEAARRKGYTIFFMPHVQFLSKANEFEIKDPKIVSICNYDIRYRDVFAMSSLLVTDYSSVVFDFAYLHKPVLYCQFDKEAFFKDHTVKKGYFDFEEHGFGEVTYNYEDTVKTLISYIENDCQMKKEYIDRTDSFFKYTDHNCCERICQKVFELEKQSS